MTTALLLTSLRRYWYLVLSGVVVGALLGIGVSAVLPKKYDATSLLLLSAPGISQPTDGSDYVESRMPTYASLVTARPVLDRAAKTLGQDPATVTDKLVSADVEESTLLITVTARGKTPQGAAALVDAVARAFADLAPSLDNSKQILEVTIVNKAALPVKTAGLSAALLMLMGAVVGLTAGLLVALARQAFPRESRLGQPSSGTTPTSTGDAARMRRAAG